MSVNIQHKGIILSESKSGWDQRGATWCCAFKDDDGTIYLYYSGFGDGAEEPLWSIGLATSRDGVNFTKTNGPILEHSSFCSWKAWTPAVFRVGNRFFMIFAGSSKDSPGGKIGISWADDPKGPFRIVKEILKPESSWEGLGIDLGPSIIQIAENEFLVYYSNHSISLSEQILNMIRLIMRRGLNTITLKDRYRYVHRRIGIAKIKIWGASKWSIEVHRYQNNPLLHLNGSWGDWNESLFCPGCLKIEDYYYLIPTASTYSIGFPYKQYVGLIKSRSPFFEQVLDKRILIDGPAERLSVMPSARSQLAFDTPSPILMDKEERIYLYYSIMDRAEGVWRIALSTFYVSDLLSS